MRVSISGALRLPSGVGVASGCTGTVEVAVQHAGSTLGLRRAALHAGCRYQLAVWVRSPRHRRLTVQASFFGNAVLAPAAGHRYLPV